MRDPARLPDIITASAGDKLRFLVRVVLPTWLKGVLLRRHAMVALAARLDLDRKAIRCLQQLRRKYGDCALLLRTSGRRQLLVLSASGMQHVLDGAPAPFSPSSQEKRAALSHFEPHGSLILRGTARTKSRQLNDEALQSSRPEHSLTQHFVGIVRSQAARLLDTARERGELAWPAFTEAWYAAARRIVLGDRAGADRELTQKLARLRASANWVFLAPTARALRRRFHADLKQCISDAEPNSLAGLIVRQPRRSDEFLVDQVTQWLFAFDGGGITTFRTLALLAAHPEQRVKALTEVQAWRAGKADLPYLRAAFLDTVRLWPTTPVILRETTQETAFGATVLPKDTGIILYLPFFHRDDERVTSADRFDPDFWLGRDPAADAAPFVPFSGGPAACPGRHVITLIGGMWLAALLDAGSFPLIAQDALRADRPLPGTLDHFSLRFRCA